MKPSYEELKDSTKFTKMLEINHHELIDFIFVYIKPVNLFTGIFKLFNFGAIIWLGVELISYARAETFSWWYFLIYFILGVIVFMLILPVHELLHGLVYKLAGAPSVKYLANLRSFYFYAIADKFVTNRQTFYILALTPFLLINGCLLFCLFILKGYLIWTCFSALILHASGCIGDFALLSFIWMNQISFQNKKTE
jgi:hypothetical protein